MKAPVLAFCLSLSLVGVARADSLNVRTIGFHATPEWAVGVAVVGDYAYVAAWTGGFRVISVADPANPVEVGYWHASGCKAQGVHVVDGLAYLADDSILRVISVIDPAHPVELGQCSTPGTAYAVAVREDHAYVADAGGGLRVVSVADPAHPFEVGHYSGADGAHDVVVDGNYLYIADDGDGLCVVSVTDPANPVEVGRCVGTGRALGVAVVGNYAYLAGGSSGLRVISVADPMDPIDVGHCASQGAPNDAAVMGDYVYVTSWFTGLRVVSVADPADPVEVGYRTLGTANSVAVKGGYAYVGDHGGLYILQFYGGGVEETPHAEVRTSSRVSSITRGVLLVAEAASRKPQATSLLDASGRKVLALHPGANDVSRLGRGVYFVREEPQAPSQECQSVRKVVTVD